MRHIEKDALLVTAAWQGKAKAALDAARTKTEGKERKDYIASKAALWAELKPELEKLSDKKCWYCESYEKRSDRAVDHYRPKNNVRDSTHNGYWWLVFRPDNYRLSCTYCNSRRADRATGNLGGKGDYFPLHDETKRVYNEAEDARCKYEDPLLLDPCNVMDVGHLWYSDDGRVIPKYSKAEKDRAFLRASTSIEYYHLNEIEIKEARLGLYKVIAKNVKEGDYHFQDSLSGNASAERALSIIIQALAKLKSKKSEFSAFATAIIQGFKITGREWLDAVDLVQ